MLQEGVGSPLRRFLWMYILQSAPISPVAGDTGAKCFYGRL